MIEPTRPFQGMSMTFLVTEDCNMRCSYCYEHNKRKADLPLDTAMKFIQLMLDDPDPIGVMGTHHEWILNQGAVLDFLGGDAFMRVDLCEEIIKHFQFYSMVKQHRWAKRWRANFSTNGTLFGDPKVRSFMHRYKDNISVGISIDGCPEIHDRNRIFPNGKGSMSTIMKWWNWYHDWTGGNPNVKATLNRESIPYIAESVKYMHEDMKISRIFMNFIFEDMDLDDHDLAELDHQMNLVVEYVLEHRDDMYLSMIDRNMGRTGTSEGSDLDTAWCGAGSMPCVVPNGNIYPCFRFTPLTHSSKVEDFPFGNVAEGLIRKDRLEEIRSQTRRKISPPECLTCDAERGCSWCIGGAYSSTGTFYRGLNLCKPRKIISRWADRYWNTYDKLNAKEVIA